MKNFIFSYGVYLVISVVIRLFLKAAWSGNASISLKLLRKGGGDKSIANVVFGTKRQADELLKRTDGAIYLAISKYGWNPSRAIEEMAPHLRKYDKVRVYAFGALNNQLASELDRLVDIDGSNINVAIYSVSPDRPHAYSWLVRRLVGLLPYVVAAGGIVSFIPVIWYNGRFRTLAELVGYAYTATHDNWGSIGDDTLGIVIATSARQGDNGNIARTNLPKTQRILRTEFDQPRKSGQTGYFKAIHASKREVLNGTFIEALEQIPGALDR